jgi:FMN-dependent oxidoreductase (nitrilotriacetate monooxygenase family)
MADVLGAHEELVKTDNPEEADVILFNTCSVREKAQERVFHDLGRVRALKTERPDLIIGVGGCVASQEGAAIVGRAPFVDVVFGLWDSFEDGALLLDRENGIYYDKDKHHTLNHKGKHFQVRGPLNIARTPQGRPVIAQAGGSEPGMDMAARTAEIVFSLASNIDRNRAFYENVKRRMPALGRDPDDLKIMPGIVINVGETEAEAKAKVDYLIDKMHPDVGRLMLSEFLEADLRDVALDKPFPMDRLPAAPKGSRALFDELVDFVRSGRTVGELMRHYAEKHTGNGMTGTPAQIADFMEEWFETRAADGFILMFPTLPSSLDDFVRLVLPELRRRGLFREEYEGKTLRENLGLSMPVNRFAKTQEPAR